MSAEKIIYPTLKNMFDKNIFFYKKFYRVIDTIFFLKKNKNIV
jgi:hypothetical protein